MNKRASVQGLSDIAFFLLLTLITVLFATLFFLQSDRAQDELAGSAMHWEVMWSANAMVNYPLESQEGKTLRELTQQELTRDDYQDIEQDLRAYLDQIRFANKIKNPHGALEIGALVIQDSNVVADIQIYDDEEYTHTYLSGKIMTEVNQTAYYESRPGTDRGIAKLAGEHPITVFTKQVGR